MSKVQNKSGKNSIGTSFFCDYPSASPRNVARWRHYDSSQSAAHHSPASSHPHSPSICLLLLSSASVKCSLSFACLLILTSVIFSNFFYLPITTSNFLRKLMTLCSCVAVSLRQSMIEPVFLYLALVVPFSTNSSTFSARRSFSRRTTLVRAEALLFSVKQRTTSSTVNSSGRRLKAS